ncbi:MAG: hypothetical protein KDA24_09875 [Deltaproteobacteria bacterium]|nr:hypothetical protein [Deltaproteobacteria bacterium]
MRRSLSAVFCLFALAACPSSSEPEPVVDEVVPLEPPPEGSGFQLEMLTTAPAGTEVWKCQVSPMPNTELASVNWVQYQQNPGLHHMTLSTPGLGPSDMEPGIYDCDDVYTGEFMESQIMFFGSQGTAEDELHLPDRVAAQFPAGLTVVHEVHYVNTTPEDVDVYSRVNAWTIPDSIVEDGIWGGSIRDENINLPVGEETSEWSRCVFNQPVEVQFLASHQHQKGTRFQVRPFDGTETGELIFDNDDWHDPKITQFDPPLVVPAGEGFEFTCTWDNDTDAPLTYGLTSDDEMCNLAVVHTPFSLTAQCEVVETSDGVLWAP